MEIFVTGGTGFIGSAIATRLLERGDRVRALVRGTGRGAALADAGAELVEGGLDDTEAIASGMRDADAVIHGAAIYEVGIPSSEHERMYDTNVGGTERVLGAALDQGIEKVVYVSTVAALGNTHGEVVDEAHEHEPRYTSYYDETKHLAHLAAKRLIGRGLPCVIVQPGAVYGPGDHSQVGNVIDQYLAGKLPAVAFPDLGFTLVHRDDVADGVLAALDRGRPGEAYVLGGELATMRELLGAVARVTGRRPPRLTVPTIALKASVPLGPIVGPKLGYPPNLGELVRSSDGVTFWARSDKARAELGYDPRPLERGLRDMLVADGRLPAAGG